jgi:hypothetical protein
VIKRAKRDRVDVVVVFADAEIVDYYPFENKGVPIEGINTRAKAAGTWIPLFLIFIPGF